MRRACDNPFAVHRVLGQRYRLTPDGWRELHRRFESAGRRGAIVGEHGCGKTTLLEDFTNRLAGDGWTIRWLRFDDRARHLGALPHFTSRDLVACDGAEQLSGWDWTRLARAASSAGGLLVTTHRPGRLPTIHRCETSESLIHEIVASLDESVPQERISEVYRAHAGNIRDAIRTLYDDWSART